ncbi:MAG: translocation/assembly module TamB domain-containing protein [Vicinamibacterales bacterium]
MGPGFRRRAGMAAAGMAALVLVVLGLVHTPPVRSRVLAWAIRTLDTRLGLALTADTLSYNVLTGTATLTNVRLAASGRDAEPILTAARVRADLPLSAYSGRLAFDDIAIDDGQVVVRTAADGTSNLPSRGASAGNAASAPFSLDLRGLHLRNVSVLYEDATTPLRVQATGIDTELEHRAIRVFDGATGPFAVRGGVDLAFGERALRIEPIDARLAFEGNTVSMQDLPIQTRLGTLALSGRIVDVFGPVGFELTFEGSVETGETGSLVTLPVPVSGTARVSGSVTGPASTVETTVRLDAPGLEVGTEDDLQVSGEVLVDRGGVRVNRVMASPRSGGQVNASLEVPFGDAPFSIEASWDGLDARVPMRAGNVDVRPVGTRLDGRARYTSGRTPALAAETTLSPIREPGLTPLDGRLRADIDDARWSVVHRLTSGGISAEGTARGRYDADAPLRSSLDGATTVVVSSLDAADRSLAPLGVRIPEAVRPIGGALENRVALAGTLGSPRATIDTRAPALDIPGVGPASLTATIDAGADRVHVAPLELTRGSATVGGEIDVDLAGGRLDGTLRATVGDLADVWRTDDGDPPAAGTIEAIARLSGTPSDPIVDATLSSPSIEAGGDLYSGLEGTLHFADETVTIPSLSVHKGDGLVTLQGRYGLDRSYEVQLDASDMRWSRTFTGDAETIVAVNGRFSGTGTIDEPGGEGRFQFAITGGVAGDLIGDGSVDIVLAGDHGRIQANAPKLGAFASALVGLHAPYDYRGAAVLNHLDLATIAPVLGVIVPGQLTGQLSLTAAAIGAAGSQQPPHVEANLQELSAQVAGVPVTLASPATVTWEPGELALRDLTAHVGEGTLTGHGEWSGRDNTVVGGTFDGQLADLIQAATAFGLETDVRGTGHVTAEAFATANRGDLIASVELDEGRISIGGTTLSNLTVDAGITGEAVTVRAVSGHAEAARLSGDFTADGQATLPDMNPRRADGRFVIQTARFDAAGVDVQQTRPSVFTIDDGVVRLDDVVWEAAGSTLTVGGTVDASQETPALDLSLAGVAVLRVLSAFLPDVAIDGTADVDVKVGGTTADPDLAGGMTLKGVEVAVPTPRFVISDLTGPIALAGDRVEFRGLSGSANGGRLVIDGGILLDGLAFDGGELYVQADGVAVEYPSGLRSEIDALLTYDLSGATPLLRGDVRVLRSSYTDPISLAALARANAGTTVRTSTGDSSSLDNLRLNIDVTTVTDLHVDNNYGRFDAGAQVRLVGTASQPGMSGQVTLREGGAVYAAGRTFTLTRGSVSFTNLNRIEPDLDIQAVTRTSTQGDVTLTVSGTPDRFEVDLNSDQGGSQEEIATALLGGGVTGSSALALLSTDLLGAAGRELGLDALRIDRGDVIRDEFREGDEVREDPSAATQDVENPATRLTLSKRLRENVEFTVSQNLAESGRATFIVSYFPIRNLEIRGISRDDQSIGLGVRHQVTLGSGGASTTRVEQPVVRVGRVQFDGSLAPLDEAVVREALRLKPKAVFDYFSFQNDMEALTDLFVARGYFEARARPADRERRRHRGPDVRGDARAVDAHCGRGRGTSGERNRRHPHDLAACRLRQLRDRRRGGAGSPLPGLRRLRARDGRCRDERRRRREDAGHHGRTRAARRAPDHPVHRQRAAEERRAARHRGSRRPRGRGLGGCRRAGARDSRALPRGGVFQRVCHRRRAHHGGRRGGAAGHDSRGRPGGARRRAVAGRVGRAARGPARRRGARTQPALSAGRRGRGPRPRRAPVPHARVQRRPGRVRSHRERRRRRGDGGADRGGGTAADPSRGGDVGRHADPRGRGLARAAPGHRGAGEPGRVVTGPQAPVRHQRLPHRRRRGGADGRTGERRAGRARAGDRGGVSAVAAALRLPGGPRTGDAGGRRSDQLLAGRHRRDPQPEPVRPRADRRRGHAARARLPAGEHVPAGAQLPRPARAHGPLPVRLARAPPQRGRAHRAVRRPRPELRAAVAAVVGLRGHLRLPLRAQPHLRPRARSAGPVPARCRGQRRAAHLGRDPRPARRPGQRAQGQLHLGHHRAGDALAGTDAPYGKLLAQQHGYFGLGPIVPASRAIVGDAHGFRAAWVPSNRFRAGGGNGARLRAERAGPAGPGARRTGRRLGVADPEPGGPLPRLPLAARGRLHGCRQRLRVGLTLQVEGSEGRLRRRPPPRLAGRAPARGPGPAGLGSARHDLHARSAAEGAVVLRDRAGLLRLPRRRRREEGGATRAPGGSRIRNLIGALGHWALLHSSFWLLHSALAFRGGAVSGGRGPARYPRAGGIKDTESDWGIGALSPLLHSEF